MNKGKHTYYTENCLSDLLTAKMLDYWASGQQNKKIKDVEEELAEYCEIKRKSIVDIKKGLCQPSLPVSMMIAKYFNLSIEDIFTLKTKEAQITDLHHKVNGLLTLIESRVIPELDNKINSFIHIYKDTNYTLVNSILEFCDWFGGIKDLKAGLENVNKKLEKVNELLVINKQVTVYLKKVEEAFLKTRKKTIGLHGQIYELLDRLDRIIITELAISLERLLYLSVEAKLVSNNSFVYKKINEFRYNISSNSLNDMKSSLRLTN